MLKSYPPSVADSGDSGGYLGMLAATLLQYPTCVATRCADPIKGVASTTRFKPTVADLTAWCERELEGLRTIVDRDDRIRHTRDQRKVETPPPTQTDKERVAAKLADTLDALGAAGGRKTEAEVRREAEQTLERCLREANSGMTIPVSDQLAAQLNPHHGRPEWR